MTGSGPDDAALQGMQRLQQDGAQRFDPLGFRFIEALSERTHAHQGRARAVLDARLTHAVAALQARMEQANIAQDAPTAPATGASESALRGLVQRLEALAPAGADVRAAEASTAQPELKSVRYFRKTWARLSADKQVTQALNRAPRNAGPINSHMVVLRSLALMRDTSPDYLNRFMAYVDTLLCLEQAKVAPPAPAKAARSRSR